VAQVSLPQPFGLHDYAEARLLSDERIAANVLGCLHERFIHQLADCVASERDGEKPWGAEDMTWQPWLDLLVSWFPLLLLILIFALYAQALRRRFSTGQQLQADLLAEQRRHNETLEKLLVQQDTRLRKLEDDH
jgi:hypothetical protein